MKAQWVLFAVYMLLTNLSVALTSARLAVLAMALLLVMVLLRYLRRGRLWAWALTLAVLAVLSTAAALQWAPVAMFLAPSFVNLGLAWLFGHTLLNGQTPLVAIIVRLLHTTDDIQDPSVWDYARSVTVCWTALFVFNATVCLLLAAFSAPEGLLALAGYRPAHTVPIGYWAFYSDVGCYGLMALMFAVEFLYRRRRFPWQPYRSLFDFLRQAVGVGPALAAELWPRKNPPPQP